MAPFPRSSRSHAERGLARRFARRSPIEGRDSPAFSSVAPSASPAAPAASPTPSRSAPAGVSLPPHGAAALVAIVVVLCFFVFSFAGWRIWVWRRNKKAASSAFLNKSSNVPGLFSPVDAIYDVKRSMSQSSSVVNVKMPTDVKAVMTSDHLPAVVKFNLNYEPKVIYAVSEYESKESRKSMPPPGITVTPAPSSLQITPPPSYVKVPKPALSPRTASRIQSTVPIAPTARLPRLVIVETTFTTTLHDELDIREGETLRLLEEYEDEWCLVQRVGPADAEKGVIPRFCVIDKPDVAVAKKSTHIPRLSTFSRI